MSTSEKTRPQTPPAMRVVGTPQVRKEGLDKVLGRAKYVDDLVREGMWHGATVRSTLPRGRILAIHYGAHVDWSEFVIVTAADIPGKNYIQMISADWPCLVEEVTNHCNEAILLLAHPDKRRLPAAVAAIPHRLRAAPSRALHRRERDWAGHHLGR